MQYRLLFDPFDSTYGIFIYYKNTYYYREPNHWSVSKQEVLFNFVGFTIDERYDVDNDDLLKRIEILQIFTPESNPEYFL